MKDLLRKSWHDFKAVSDGNGGFEGYASLFGIRDEGGDIVEAGAFAETLPEFIQRGFIPVGHEWGGLPVGYVTDAHEDERGLYIKIAYHSTKEAQDARAVAQERMAAGKFVGLSIGYMVAPGGAVMKADGRHITKVDLYEVSQVNAPMLKPAGLTAVKSAHVETKSAADGSYEQLIGRVCDAVCDLIHGGFSDRFGWVMYTYPTYCIAKIYDDWDAEEPTYWAIPYTIDDSGMPVLGEPQALEMQFVPADAAVSMASMTYALHGDRVLGRLKGFVDRTQALAAVRAQDGRRLNDANLARLKALRDDMHAAMGTLDALLVAEPPQVDGQKAADVEYDALATRLLTLRLSALGVQI